MGKNIIKRPGEQSHILKNMQEYLKNPNTIKDLYKALTAMPREEFYDLHPEELGEVAHIYFELSKIDKNNGALCHEISEMLRLKDDVERLFVSLYHALQEYPVADYFSEDEKEKKDVSQYQIKSMFRNIIHYLEKYKKHITTDGIYALQGSQESIIRHLELLKTLEDRSLAAIITYILQHHIYTGSDPLEKALQHLMEIHGEDVSRPLLRECPDSGGYTWDSLLFMRYGFGQIDINELVAGIKRIIDRKNQEINELIEPFIPIYKYLHMVLKETNAPQEEHVQIVPFESEDIDELPDFVKIKDIRDCVYDNDCLKILLKTDRSILEEKLMPLKEICNIQKGKKTLLA